MLTRIKKIHKKWSNLISKNNASQKQFFLKIYDDDMFLVSYPKSGNTWLRFLIGNYITDGNCNLDNVRTIIPPIDRKIDIEYDKLKRPRIFKSHFLYRREFKNVIYITRDPRDVAVSYYFYNLRRMNMDKDTSFSEFVEMFNSGNLGFCSWKTHVNSWLNNKKDRLLLVKYEDLHSNPIRELEKIVKFMDLEVVPEKLIKAVNESSFDKLSSNEKEKGKWAPGNAIIDERFRFFRYGKPGDYVNYFDNITEKAFIVNHKDALVRLKYL